MIYHFWVLPCWVFKSIYHVLFALISTLIIFSDYSSVCNRGKKQTAGWMDGFMNGGMNWRMEGAVSLFVFDALLYMWEMKGASLKEDMIHGERQKSEEIRNVSSQVWDFKKFVFQVIHTGKPSCIYDTFNCLSCCWVHFFQRHEHTILHIINKKMRLFAIYFFFANAQLNFVAFYLSSFMTEH